MQWQMKKSPGKPMISQTQAYTCCQKHMSLENRQRHEVTNNRVVFGFLKGQREEIIFLIDGNH
jgi:hypothetical protein